MKMVKKIYVNEYGKELKLTDEEYYKFPFNSKLRLIGIEKVDKVNLSKEEEKKISKI